MAMTAIGLEPAAASFGRSCYFRRRFGIGGVLPLAAATVFFGAGRFWAETYFTDRRSKLRMTAWYFTKRLLAVRHRAIEIVCAGRVVTSAN